MKIGIVCYPTYGGSGVIATELGIGLAMQGHEIHFITYKRPARLSSFYSNIFLHEVNTGEYPLFQFPPYETALASKLVDVIRYEKLDILHVHYAIPHAAAAFMAKQVLKSHGREIPVVTTLHGTDITLVGTDASFSPVVEFSINNSDGVTAVSEHLRQQTYDNFEIKKEIKVIHNFIDFTRFKKTDKTHFRKAIAQDDEKILVHISNFRKVKRVDDVIHMFQKVSEQTKAILLLIGDGPERQHLEDLCRKLGLCDRIRFLGKQDAIEELLAIADLFILPSENESFGLAALEAMACQVPVISSNAGGIPEVNIHGQTGFVHEIGDYNGMAKSALKLFKDPLLFQEMRKSALAKAKEFNIDAILPQYVGYYEQVLNDFKVKAAVAHSE